MLQMSSKRPPFVAALHRSAQRIMSSLKKSYRRASNYISLSWRRSEKRFGKNPTRIGAGLLALLIVSSVVIPVAEQLAVSGRYRLDAERLKLVGATDPSLSKQLSYDNLSKSFVFNKDVIDTATNSNTAFAELQKASVGAKNASNAKTYALTVPENFNKGVTYYDANSQLNFKLIPNFKALDARTEQGHIVFPTSNDAQVVYTLKNNGLKEDVLLPVPTEDTATYSYTFELPKSLEVRMISDSGGAIGIYSANPALFGDVSYATNEDKAKVEQARQNAEKTNLVFALPAPVITSATGSIGSATVRYELNGTELKVVAEHLLSAGKQLLSIDPSVVVTSTSDFEFGGNNEGDIEFSVSGQVTRGGLTGADVGAWGSTASLSYNAEHIASVFYNNYMYVIGGTQRSPATQYTTVSYAAVGSGGTLGTWNTTTALSAYANQGRAIAYNGYLYYLGGARTGGASTEVDYAKINSDGTIGSWSTTTSLPAINQSFGCAAANGYIYVLGGNPTGGTSAYSDVYVAPILANGTIGTWSATTSLSYQRNAPTANIYNGFIYIFGGSNTTPTFVSDVQYAKINADGTLGSWVTTNNFTTARYGHISAFYNGYVYLYGGWGGAYPTTVQYAQVNANGSLSTWTTSANNFTNGRTYVAGSIYKGYLYIGGGWSGSVDYADFQYTKIEPQGKMTAFTNSGNSISTARRYTQTVAAYGWLYIIGGDSGGSASTSVARMPINAAGTLGTYTTTSITQMGTGRMLFGAFVADSYLYVIGGCSSTLANCNTSGNALATVYSAKITASTGALGAWTQQSSLSTARYGFGTAILNGYVYVFGGTANGGGSPLTSIEYASFDYTNGTVNAWTTASSTYDLPVGLSNFAIAVNGNTVYIAGGCTTGTANSCSAWTNAVYHIQLSGSGGLASTWSSGGTDASFTNSRYGLGMTVVNGILYIIGGYDNTTYYSDSQYAPIAANGTVGTWQTGTSMATTAMGSSVSSQNGMLYVVGGYNGSYQTTVRYSTTNNGGRGQTSTWTTNATDLTAIYPSGTGYGKTVAFNGYLYLIGGASSSSNPQTTVAYAPLSADGSVGSWTTTSSMQTPRLQHAAFAYNGYLYAIGGQTTGSVNTATVEYAKINSNGTVGAWAYASSLNSTWGGLSGLNATAYNGYLYVAGGTNSSGVQTEVQYAQTNTDGTLGSWTATTSFTTARKYHGVVAVNGYLYIIGGFISSGNYLSDVQAAPINSDGTIGSWIYTTPMPATNSDGIFTTYNGYLYVYTGTNSSATLSPSTNIWYAPLNADGTVGRWEMVAGSSFTTARSHAAGVIYNGYVYLLSGNSSPYLSDIQYSPVTTIERKGVYSRMVSLNVANVSSVVYNGLLPNGNVNIRYRAYSSNGTLLASGLVNDITTLGSCTTSISSASYLFLYVTLDDTSNGGSVHADSSGTNAAKLTDITVNYLSGHPASSIRLRHGQTLQSGNLSSLDTCVL